MSGKTKIEWCDATWNVTAGCSKVSSGCAHCYAERVAWRLRRTVVGYEHATEIYDETGEARLQWTGYVGLRESELSRPLRWKKPRRIFVNSMSDLFHEKVQFGFIDKVFAIMALCPQHTFMVLTKRAARMREYFESMKKPDADFRGESCGEWLRSVVHSDDEWSRACNAVSDFMRSVGNARPNVMLGVSVEDQATADERIPLLLATPAEKRFVSYEPGIRPIVFAEQWMMSCRGCDNNGCIRDPASIDWVVMGCESGPNARPMDIEWARSVRGQCSAARVPFFLKQMMVGGKLVKMPEIDGVVHDAMPEVK